MQKIISPVICCLQYLENAVLVSQAFNSEPYNQKCLKQLIYKLSELCDGGFVISYI